jgi:hypothetical protein
MSSIVHLPNVLPVVVAGQAAVHCVARRDHLGKVSPQQAAQPRDLPWFDAVLALSNAIDKLTRDGQIVSTFGRVEMAGQGRRRKEQGNEQGGAANHLSHPQPQISELSDKPICVGGGLKRSTEDDPAP